MRDVIITAFVFGTFPFILMRPWVGMLVYAWLSLMTPYRFAFGFAYDLPFVQLVALVTLVSLLINSRQVRVLTHPIVVLLALLPLWTCVTTLFALEQAAAVDRLVELLKMFVLIHVAALVLRERRHVHWMVWVMVVSVGFYGVKGGAFTLLTGGESKVWGPPGKSFMSDNNAIGIAIIMVVPLMYYLRDQASSWWLRHALLAAMALCTAAAIGTYSRGSFLAVSAMLFFLWLKSQRKVLLALIFVLLIPVGLASMPDRWFDRMNSISSYKEDGSAMGRINSWTTLFNIANDRPLVGGGFELYTPRVFARYAPNPEDLHSAHSVYFQMLGEHGYPGLLLFLTLMIVVWVSARRTIAAARGRPELDWAASLARALQVCLVGYAVGGLFINISYWELMYYELMLVAIIHRIVTTAVAEPAPRPDATRAVDARLAERHT